LGEYLICSFRTIAILPPQNAAEEGNGMRLAALIMRPKPEERTMEASLEFNEKYHSPSLETPRFDRIRAHTSDEVNSAIDEQILKNVEEHSHSPEAIERRLEALDHEWDIDRALMANFSVIAFSALMAGIFKNRRFLLLPAIQIPFLFMHAVEGWCPPLPILRRMGFRTRQEIEAEKMELRKTGARNYLSQPHAFPLQ
jgi:hypothetical protein